MPSQLKEVWAQKHVKQIEESKMILNNTVLRLGANHRTAFNKDEA